MSYSSATLELAVEAYEVGRGAGALLAEFEPDPALVDARARAQLLLEKEALLRIRVWASELRAAMSGLDEVQRQEAPRSFTLNLALAIEKVRVDLETLNNHSQDLRRSVADPRVVLLLDGFSTVVGKAAEQLTSLVNETEGFVAPAKVGVGVRFLQSDAGRSDFDLASASSAVAQIGVTGGPSQLKVIADAVSNVTASFGKLGRVLGASENGKSALLGKEADGLAQLIEVKASFAQLIYKTKALGTLGNLERDILVQGVETWVSMSDKLLAALEEAESMFQSSSREIKRKFARRHDSLRRAGSKVAEIRDLLFDFGESLEPTPQDYIAREVHRIHGDSTSLLASFSELSNSENSSLEIFKKRHDLK